jgi:subtilisin family serine protease
MRNIGLVLFLIIGSFSVAQEEGFNYSLDYTELNKVFIDIIPKNAPLDPLTDLSLKIPNETNSFPLENGILTEGIIRYELPQDVLMSPKFDIFQEDNIAWSIKNPLIPAPTQISLPVSDISLGLGETFLDLKGLDIRDYQTITIAGQTFELSDRLPLNFPIGELKITLTDGNGNTVEATLYVSPQTLAADVNVEGQRKNILVVFNAESWVSDEQVDSYLQQICDELTNGDVCNKEVRRFLDSNLINSVDEDSICAKRYAILETTGVIYPYGIINVKVEGIVGETFPRHTGQGSADILGSIGARTQDGNFLPLDASTTEKNLDGSTTTIYVLDTGYSEQLLAQNEGLSVLLKDEPLKVESRTVLPDYSTGDLQAYFREGQKKPFVGHGTWVALIAGGHSISVAPEARVISVRVCSDPDTCRVDHVVQGLCQILSDQPTNAVINMSLAFLEESTLLSGVLSEVVSKGFIVITAGGHRSNYNLEDISTYPANSDIEGVISVGAGRLLQDNINYEFEPYSNQSVDIVAPGQSMNDSDMVGTSFSTAYVTGVVALLKQKFGDELTPQMIEKCSDGFVNLEILLTQIESEECE